MSCENGAHDPRNILIISLTPQTQQKAGALTTILAFSTGQISDVGVRGQSLSNLTAGVDPTNLNQTSCQPWQQPC